MITVIDTNCSEYETRIIIFQCMDQKLHAAQHYAIMPESSCIVMILYQHDHDNEHTMYK